MATSSISDFTAIFPFNLFPTTSNQATSQQQSSGSSSTGLLGLPAGLPFFNFPLLANGEYPSFPVSVPIAQQQAGNVPMGIPILPAFSTLPALLAQTFDKGLSPIDSSVQQAASSQSSMMQSAMSAVTSFTSTLRNSIKSSLLAPETARQEMVGQFTPALIMPEQQQGYQPQSQQQSQPAPLNPNCTYIKQQAGLCTSGTASNGSTTPPQVQ